MKQEHVRQEDAGQPYQVVNTDDGRTFKVFPSGNVVAFHVRRVGKAQEERLISRYLNKWSSLAMTVRAMAKTQKQKEGSNG